MRPINRTRTLLARALPLLIVTALFGIAPMSITMAQTEATSYGSMFTSVLASEIDEVVVPCSVLHQDLPDENTGCIRSWGDLELTRMSVDLAMRTYSDVRSLQPWESEMAGSTEVLYRTYEFLHTSGTDHMMAVTIVPYPDENYTSLIIIRELGWTSPDGEFHRRYD